MYSGDKLNSKIKSVSGGDTVPIEPVNYTAVQLENKSYSSSNLLVIKSDETVTVRILAKSGKPVELNNCSY